MSWKHLGSNTTMETPQSSHGNGAPRARRSQGCYNGINLDDDGIVMSAEQIIERRVNRGQCTSCSNEPTQCFLIKRSKFNPLIRSKIPLTVDGLVFEGHCLVCNPEKDPNRRRKQKEWRRRSRKKLLDGSTSGQARTVALTSVPDNVAEMTNTEEQTVAVSFSSSSFSARSAPETSNSSVRDAFATSPSIDADDRRSLLERTRSNSASDIEGRSESSRRRDWGVHYDSWANRNLSGDSQHASEYPRSNSIENNAHRRTASFGISPPMSSLVCEDEDDTSSTRAVTDHIHSGSLPDLPDLDDTNLPVARAVSEEEVDDVTPVSSAFWYNDEPKPSNLSESCENQTNEQKSNDSKMDKSVAELQDLVHDLMKQSAKDHAIDVIATAMMERPGCAELVGYSIWTLWKLSRENVKLKEKIVYSNGLDAIVEGMETNLYDQAIQERGCGALWSLAVEEKHHSNIAAAGGCRLVLDALSTHSESVEVVTKALGAVKTLSGNCDDTRVALEIGRAAQIAARAMKENLRSEKVQAEGCFALSRLSISPSDEVSVCSAEEINAIASALEAHPDSVKVQFGGCTALKNFVAGGSANIRTVRSCGLPVEKLVETARDRFPHDCRENAAEVLESLVAPSLDVPSTAGSEESMNDAERTDAATGEIIDTIINAMFEDTSSAEKQVKCLQELCSLCLKSEEDCEKVAGSVALEVIATAMTLHESDAGIQENALYVLWEIASSSETKNKVRMIHSGVCSCIVHATTVHKKQEAIQKMSMAIMSVLSEDQECREALKMFE